MATNDNRVSRRRFLKRCAATTGGAVFLPAIFPASALGRGGLRAPSERIQMGFIGLGGQGTGHLLGGAWTYVPGGYAAREDVQVLAVCDVRRERREHAQARCNAIYAQKFGQAAYQGVSAHNDFREVLARPDIDAVLLALPYHWAAPMSVMAMRAGKDVYCEKPCAITVREGGAVVETAKRFSRVYQAGTQQRSEYAGKFRLVCELVRNGRIGQLKEVYAFRQPGAFFPSPWTSDASSPAPDGFDWDLWLGPLPWRPFNGEAGHALSGMFVGDVNWAPHHYDFIQWVVNPDPKAPLEVSCEPRGPNPDDAVVHYRYANGVVVHSSACAGEPVGGEGGACFVGTEGRIAVERSNLVADPARILSEPIRPGDARVYRSDSHSGNFLECIRTRRPTICDPETAIYSMNAILIGGIALILRRTLRWDPVKSEFIGDAEANRLLSYAPRPPWGI
ncbi:MAG TPA: Gfo/Idh/MocA family oxidoreductase [Verrucomicrobiota bacterium]|nr:Gfo/Idh/MocA family oxidoreductase [Verrucomicrobiota bacterium]